MNMLPHFLPKKAFRNHPIILKSKTSRREALKYKLKEKEQIYHPAETHSKRYTNAPKQVYLIYKFKFNKLDLIANLLFSIALDVLIYVASLLFDYKLLISRVILIFITFFVGAYIYRKFIAIRYYTSRLSRPSRTFAILSFDGIFVQNNQFLWKEISSIKIRINTAPEKLKKEYAIVIKEFKDKHEYIFQLGNVIFNKSELEYLLYVYKNKSEEIKVELNPNFEKTFLDFKYSYRNKYIMGTYHVPDLGV